MLPEDVALAKKHRTHFLIPCSFKKPYISSSLRKTDNGNAETEPRSPASSGPKQGDSITLIALEDFR